GLGQARHLGPRGEGLLGIYPPVEVVLDVLGSQRYAAVELDSFLQMEGPCEPVAGDLPALGKSRADLHLEVVKHQPVVEEKVGGDGRQPGGAPWIERVGIVVAPDGEGAATLGLVLGDGDPDTCAQRDGPCRAQLEKTSTVEHRRPPEACTSTCGER